MNRILYLMLAVTVIIGAVGIVKLSTLFKQSLIDLQAKNGFIASGVGDKIAYTEEDRVKKIIKSKISDGDVLSSLPCFKCHQMQTWEGIDSPGSFPHTFHIAMKLQCMDCHIFVAHGKGMRLAQETCDKCHG